MRRNTRKGMPLAKFRRGAKVLVKNIPLDRRTVAKIEMEDDCVQLRALKIYLKAVGLKLTFSV